MSNLKKINYLDIKLESNGCNYLYYDEIIKFHENIIDDHFYNLSELLIKRFDIIENNLLTKINDLTQSLNNRSIDTKILLKKEIFKLNERYDKIFLHKNKIEEIENNISKITILLNRILENLEEKYEDQKSQTITGCIF